MRFRMGSSLYWLLPVELPAGLVWLSATDPVRLNGTRSRPHGVCRLAVPFMLYLTVP